MRCPHCAGEILDGSRFCGICGRRLAAATIPASGAPVTAARPAPSGPAREPQPATPAEAAPVTDAAMAPIELPISAGARWARILAVLALDVVLASAGVAMILSFARDCEAARGSGSAPPAAAPGSEERAGAAPGGARPAAEVRP